MAFHQVGRPPVMKEEDALADAPQSLQMLASSLPVSWPLSIPNDFPRFIQSAVALPVIAEVQTYRELLSIENHVSIYPNSASLFHSRSPFLVP
jgi:hypothetical protein